MLEVSDTGMINVRFWGRAAAYLIVALGLREVFSFWTGHPFDFELWVRMGYWVVRGFDPYTPIPPAPSLSFAFTFTSNAEPSIVYFPLWPLVCGGMYLIYAAMGIGDRFLYYFLLKQPIILGDVMLGYALYRFVMRNNKSKALWVLKFWSFSPLVILISAVWGMFDSLAMLLCMTALLVGGSVRKGLLSMLASLMKSIPFIYVLPITLGKGSKPWAFPTAALLGGVLTLWLPSLLRWDFTDMFIAMFSSAAHSLTTSMSVWGMVYYAQYEFLKGNLPSYMNIILGSAWIPAVLIMTYLSWRRWGFDSDRSVIQCLLACTLVFLLIRTQVNEQYSVYLISLLAIDVACWHPERRRMLFVVVSVVLVYLLMNNYLLVRFISPVYPSFAALEAAIDDAVGAIRFSLQLASGATFTVLNALLLRDMFREVKLPDVRPGEQFQRASKYET